MSEQREEHAVTTAEILEFVLFHSNFPPETREGIRKEHDIARGWEEAEWLREMNLEPSLEEWDDREYRDRVAFWAGISFMPLSLIGFWMVGTYGLWGLVGFWPAAIALLTCWWISPRRFTG